jgi:hypothetical protein
MTSEAWEDFGVVYQRIFNANKIRKRLFKVTKYFKVLE